MAERGTALGEVGFTGMAASPRWRFRTALLASALSVAAVPAQAVGPGSNLPAPAEIGRGGMTPGGAPSTRPAATASGSGTTWQTYTVPSVTNGGAGTSATGSAALPVGGTVAQGTAAINASGSTLDIYQSSQRAIIDWLSFNIGAAGTVNVYMPGASASELDRVTGTSPIDIEGRLNTPAGGSVFLVDAAGILFGKGATLNVGGLVASTLSIADSAFMAGNYSFARNGATAGVTNQGRISAANYVALLAPSLVNEGSITTGRMGSVALAAGETVTLTLGNGLTVQVQPATIATLIQNQAMISAPDGTVILTAKALDTLTAQVINSGTINVADTINANGGAVSLGSSGDIANTGAIVADGFGTGNGGSISVVAGGTATITGSLTARGGSQGGDGGTIETSGAVLNVAGAHVDARAAKGKGGSWLLDPYDLTVDAGAATTIAGALNAGTNVTLTTSASGASGPGTTNPAGNGDIIVASAIDWATTAWLTLSAYRNITVDAPLFDTVNGQVVLRADNTGTGTGTIVFGGIGSITTAGSISLYYNPSAGYASPTDFSANVSAGAGFTAYMLVNNPTDLQNVAENLTASYALGTSFTMPSSSFTPIGSDNTPFDGTFDGLGQTITGLTINEPSGTYVGLFGDIGGGGTVRNLTLDNVAVTGSQYVGGLAGENDGTMESSSASGSVAGTGSEYVVGGLAGKNTGTIVASFSSASVTGDGSVGGLVGANYGTLLGDVAFGSVTAIGGGEEFAGGLVGYNASTGAIVNSWATGAVTAAFEGSAAAGQTVGAAAGGLVGFNDGGIISGSWATGLAVGAAIGTIGAGGAAIVGAGGLVGINGGIVTASYASGGVIEYLSGTVSGAGAQGFAYAGGLAGYNADGAAIGDSYETGGVSVYLAVAIGTGGVAENYVGGLVGQNAGAITDAYATGGVSGGFVGSAMGGLVGSNLGTVSAAYASGDLTGASALATGGAIGDNTAGAASAVYWDADTTGQANGVGAGSGAGISALYSTSGSAPSAYQSASYAGFDFTNGWYMVNGYTRPLLTAFWSSTVTNAYQLELVGWRPGASYTLGNDVDASAINVDGAAGVWGAGHGFAPIGSAAVPFSGSFDGDYHTISNLTISNSGNDLGLFAVNTGIIGDLGLANVSITAGPVSWNVGALVGENLGGTVIVDWASGSISVAGAGANPHSAQIGGLVGENTGSVSSSSSSVSVTAGANSYYVGGAIGLEDGSDASLSSSGPVVSGSGSNNVGGLIGGMGSGSTSLDGSTTSAVTVGEGSIHVGGYAGSNWGGSMAEAYSGGPVSFGANARYVGGLVGYNAGGIYWSSSDSALTGGPNGQWIGGFVGYNSGAIYDSSSEGTLLLTGPDKHIGPLVGADAPSGVIVNSTGFSPIEFTPNPPPI